MSVRTTIMTKSSVEQSLGRIHLLLLVQSVNVLLVSINRLTSLTTGYVTANEQLQPGDEWGVGKVVSLYTKGWLPYTFRTYVAPGLANPDRQVLKIDYDLLENPGWSIRRVLDELVQLAPGLYLGKAHFKWWWGKWRLVAYFSLANSKGESVSSLFSH